MGVRVDGPFGPKVLKGLKFDSGFAAEGCGGRLRRQYDKTFTTALAGSWWLGRAPPSTVILSAAKDLGAWSK